MDPLRAPFPYFGGKARAASLIWERFGDTPNYVEPFAGSLAVLLGRPHAPRIETVNDKDAYLANFWRALQAAPDEVAHYADWPVNEVDLHARHAWLVNTAAERVERLKSDPDFFDAKVAGWWVWGICQWIGSGWCKRPDWEGRTNAGRAARGVHVTTHQKLPHLGLGKGVHRNTLAQPNKLPRKIPYLAGQGQGVHQLSHQLPSLGDGGRRVHRRPPHQLPHLNGNSGAAGAGIHAYFEALAERLRYVRVCCGDWSRVMGPSVTEKIGVTAILLDPPYAAEAGRESDLYNEDCLQVAHEVRAWALANGDSPLLRIALCGYEGEHEMPEGWECVAWKANGGYSNARKNGTNGNARKERIWFSPHCLRPDRPVQSPLDLGAM